MIPRIGPTELLILCVVGICIVAVVVSIGVVIVLGARKKQKPPDA